MFETIVILLVFACGFGLGFSLSRFKVPKGKVLMHVGESYGDTDFNEVKSVCKHNCSGEPGVEGPPGYVMSEHEAVEIFANLKMNQTYYERLNEILIGDAGNSLNWREVIYTGEGESQTPVYIIDGLMKGTIKLSN